MYQYEKKNLYKLRDRRPAGGKRLRKFDEFLPAWMAMPNLNFR